MSVCLSRRDTAQEYSQKGHSLPPIAMATMHLATPVEFQLYHHGNDEQNLKHVFRTTGGGREKPQSPPESSSTGSAPWG